MAIASRETAAFFLLTDDTDTEDRENHQHDGLCGFCAAFFKETGAKIVSGHTEQSCCDSQRNQNLRVGGVNDKRCDIGGQIDDLGNAVGLGELHVSESC